VITNDRQREITEKWMHRFEEAVAAIRAHAADGDDNARALRQIQEAGMQSEYEVLRGQLEEYDALRSGKTKTLPVASVEDLPRALIRARITAGISQSEIAHRLGLDEDRFIREEGNDYESLSVAQLREIAAMLGVKFRGDVQLQVEGRQSAA
jgi:ribosome-binding protein aMBF1 (putative translation factor)